MVHPMPEINVLLKQLRLSHIENYLPQRNREAIEKKLAYPEFLSLLLQDEMLGRENKKFQARIRRANIQSDKTLENMILILTPEQTMPKYRSWHRVALLMKRHQSSSLDRVEQVNHILPKPWPIVPFVVGIDVLWLSQSKLFSGLQAAKAADRYEKKFAELTKVTLLIIDDFGLRPMRSPQDEDFHDLISERYERTTTIVTSNLDFDEWGSAFPNKLLAAATLDRLRHNAHKVTLDGGTYRKGREPETALNQKK